ncbi:hypothetical protein GOB93_04850 [Acetobacter musti]|uniref:Uncharacterized protein n=1 Tax=Acetobacter musti TaxID=864732 RepID=A0ABX0JL59_9PROT|nr:hypothetical protein [Acetobacter musti]NHN83972.1 hypothetical protein [Acetobacter musti]
MSTMRELSVSELDAVSGGCQVFSGGCAPHPSCAPSTSVSGMIGAYAGFLAGMYNVEADYFNHASCSTIASAWQDVGTDMKLGYSATQNMSVSAATSFLKQTISAIQGAETFGKCGSVVAASTIAFPTITPGGFGS